MTRYFVIADLHGNWRALDALLDAAEIPRSPDQRQIEGIVTVQLGDLINSTSLYVEDDLEILERARDLLDVTLVGNHDWPYLGGSATFNGWSYRSQVAERTRRIDWQPCFLIGDVLLTHAGVTPEMAGRYAATTAAEMHDAICGAWIVEHIRTNDRLFCQVGKIRTGGWGPDEFGGILWSDAREPRAPFRQIHGHTAVRQGPLIRSPRLPENPTGWNGSINLDVGVEHHASRAVGLWVSSNGDIGNLVDVALDPAIY